MRILLPSTLGICALLGACANTTTLAGGGGSAGATTSEGAGLPSSGGSGPSTTSASTGGAGPSNTSVSSGGAGPSTSSGPGGGPVVVNQTGKVDLLFMIDNSRSMADKQQILATAIPDIVNALANPECLDASATPIPNQPASPTDPCPASSSRRFAPVSDMHIGVISSSLGSHGGDACPDVISPSPDCPSGTNTENNDHGHLITRADPCGTTQVSTYNNLGFLAWAPAQNIPPGDPSGASLVLNSTKLVNGIGQIGCGFESQLESWYRFLVDPSPYQTISLQSLNGAQQAVKQGTDMVLLQQRADFLRSDSLLAIVMLTDEDDGSAIEGGQYYIAEDSPHLPPPRSECATNPLDPCCRSCAQSQTGCPVDPACATVDTQPGQWQTPLNDTTDNFNQRMFDNKRRFGIDFLYPTQRYVSALTQPMINPGRPDLELVGDLGTPNPIFSDLQHTGGAVRDRSLVFLAGIVGVPWQDIAVDPTDLTKGYKTSSALGVVDAKTGVSGWDTILGDPANYVPPKDPHMIAQINPRSGTNPITGDAIAPPTSAPNADAINGHEYTVTPPGSDLQYACTFTLPTARNCAASSTSCDCTPQASPDSPLCAANPNDGGNRTLQVSAKAYPGLRELDVLHGLGDTGIVASICPAQTNDATKADYGYRPAVSALVTRIQARLLRAP